MPFIFPNTPIAGQTYQFSDMTWMWNGYAWNKVGITGTGSSSTSYLDDLLDVTITGVTNDDFLYYDNTTSQWKNRPLNTINIDGGSF